MGQIDPTRYHYDNIPYPSSHVAIPEECDRCPTSKSCVAER